MHRISFQTQNSSDSNEESWTASNSSNVQAMSYNKTDLANNSTPCYMRMVNATIKCQNETGATDGNVFI